MITYRQSMQTIIKGILEQKEAIILKELTDLVRSGLIIIEESEPILVQEPFSDELSLRQSVHIKVRNQEVIDELKAENQKLKERLEKLKHALEEAE